MLVPRPVDPGDTVEMAGMSVRLFDQDHGFTRSLGLRVGAFAYSTDAVALDEAAFAALAGVDTWLVGCFQRHAHRTHAWLGRVLTWVERVRPRRTILTHMGTDMDFSAITARLPAGVEPGYDGRSWTSPMDRDLEDLLEACRARPASAALQAALMAAARGVAPPEILDFLDRADPSPHEEAHRRRVAAFLTEGGRDQAARRWDPARPAPEPPPPVAAPEGRHRRPTVQDRHPPGAAAAALGQPRDPRVRRRGRAGGGQAADPPQDHRAVPEARPVPGVPQALPAAG